MIALQTNELVPNQPNSINHLAFRLVVALLRLLSSLLGLNSRGLLLGAILLQSLLLADVSVLLQSLLADVAVLLHSLLLHIAILLQSLLLLASLEFRALVHVAVLLRGHSQYFLSISISLNNCDGTSSHHQNFLPMPKLFLIGVLLA